MTVSIRSKTSASNTYTDNRVPVLPSMAKELRGMEQKAESLGQKALIHSKGVVVQASELCAHTIQQMYGLKPSVSSFVTRTALTVSREAGAHYVALYLAPIAALQSLPKLEGVLYTAVLDPNGVQERKAGVTHLELTMGGVGQSAALSAGDSVALLKRYQKNRFAFVVRVASAAELQDQTLQATLVATPAAVLAPEIALSLAPYGEQVLNAVAAELPLLEPTQQTQIKQVVNEVVAVQTHLIEPLPVPAVAAIAKKIEQQLSTFPAPVQKALEPVLEHVKTISTEAIQHQKNVKILETTPYAARKETIFSSEKVIAFQQALETKNVLPSSSPKNAKEKPAALAPNSLARESRTQPAANENIVLSSFVDSVRSILKPQNGEEKSILPEAPKAPERVSKTIEKTPIEPTITPKPKSMGVETGINATQPTAKTLQQASAAKNNLFADSQNFLQPLIKQETHSVSETKAPPAQLTVAPKVIDTLKTIVIETGVHAVQQMPVTPQQATMPKPLQQGTLSVAEKVTPEVKEEIAILKEKATFIEGQKVSQLGTKQENYFVLETKEPLTESAVEIKIKTSEKQPQAVIPQPVDLRASPNTHAAETVLQQAVPHHNSATKPQERIVETQIIQTPPIVANIVPSAYLATPPTPVVQQVLNENIHATVPQERVAEAAPQRVVPIVTPAIVKDNEAHTAHSNSDPLLPQRQYEEWKDRSNGFENKSKQTQPYETAPTPSYRDLNKNDAEITFKKPEKEEVLKEKPKIEEDIKHKQSETICPVTGGKCTCRTPFNNASKKGAEPPKELDPNTKVNMKKPPFKKPKP